MQHHAYNTIMQNQAGGSTVLEQLGLLSKSLLQDKSKQSESGGRLFNILKDS